MSSQLSVVVIVCDEANKIDACLRAVAFADEIIVLDSGSQDNTVAICKQHTPHVFQTDWPGYGVQKQRAVARATGDWVLSLDADEVLESSAEPVIRKAMEASSVNGYRLNERHFFLGKALKYGVPRCKKLLLFRRMAADFSSDAVHERAVVQGVVEPLAVNFNHYSNDSITHYLSKMNHYTTLALGVGKSPKNMLAIMLDTWWCFFKIYIIRRACLEGVRGYIYAKNAANYMFYKRLKERYDVKK